jgi:hypothetical protein
MAGRRTLLEGLKAKPKADRRKEEAFVYRKDEPEVPEQPEKPEKPKARVRKPEAREGEAPRQAPPATPMPQLAGRVPLTTRIRHDLATGLKRASLERQLAGEKPNTVQDILEQALEPWLKDHGYLKD